MEHWLELLRRHWNYALGQRLDWLSARRCQVNACSLIRCPMGEIPSEPPYYSQAAGLKETKRLFPEYQGIYAEVQQQNLIRLKKAWEHWRYCDQSGKRAGRPRFKKASNLRSFVFPRINGPKAGAHLKEGGLKLSRIGEMPVIQHRPIPDGVKVKTCTIVRKADGWYCCISADDISVPQPLPVENIKTAIGIDVGLEKFLVTSDGDAVETPQFFRKAETLLARRQRQLARMVKGSNNWKAKQNQIARLWLTIKRQRTDFFYRVAHWLCDHYDLMAYEKLNIKGLARTQLAKSILDAAWGEFLSILQAVAVKRGKHGVEVDAKRTSIECSECDAEVRKELSERVHHCPSCRLIIDRDWNAARNILYRAPGYQLSGCGGYGSARPVKQQLSIVKLRSPRYSALSA